MKKRVISISAIILTGALLAFAAQSLQAAEGSEVETVDRVDLQRYMGQWHEIAAIPMRFQRKCVGNTAATYTLLPDKRVKVLNACDTEKEGRISSEGRAKVEDPQTNARLRVTFARFLGRWWYLFGGDYWIIELAPDYSWAVVGHPTRRYGWILSRTPALSEATLADLAGRLRTHGYDPCDFLTTPQAGGLSRRKPLCEVAGSAATP